MPSPLLEIDDLSVDFRTRRRTVRAVAGLSLRIELGETLGLVGESGSGKTTTGRAVLGLTEATGGRIVFDGRDITHAGHKQRRIWADQIRAVFQDPFASLNPARRIADSLLEGVTGSRLTPADARARMAQLLDRVSLPAATADRYPTALSGGQCQRLAIARALMSSPRLVICDEPVSGLDVSVQAQVLNLLRELQRESSLSFLFIGHDLDVVRYMSDRIAVLYRGQIVEEGPAEVVATRPSHPYTQALVAATPEIGVRSRPHPRLGPERLGDAAEEATAGCPYVERCPLAIDVCRTETPALRPGEAGDRVACHLHPEHPNVNTNIQGQESK